MSLWAKYRLLRMAVVAIAGAVLMISSVPQAVKARETARRPVLQMTVSSCVTLEAHGHRRVLCRGSGDLGGSGVTTADWTLDDLPHRVRRAPYCPCSATPTAAARRP